MPEIVDGPHSPLFSTLPLTGNAAFADLDSMAISPELAGAVEYAPRGRCVGWGIPFSIETVVLVKDEPVDVSLPSTEAQWLVFMHTSDLRPIETEQMISPMRGEGRLGGCVLFSELWAYHLAARHLTSVGRHRAGRHRRDPLWRTRPGRGTGKQLVPDCGRTTRGAA